MGNVVNETETGGVTKTYTYNWNGSRTSFTLDMHGENALSTEYGYDNLNRMCVVRERGDAIATYTYNDNGGRASLSYPDGTVTTYAYNLANLVTRLVNANGEDTLSAYEYTYYLDGNQCTKADHTGNVTVYTYDGLGQLTVEEKSTGPRIAYEYDRFGNRARMEVTGEEDYIVDYTYDKNNRLLRDVKAVGDVVEKTSYQYDPNGNQLVREKETISPAGTSGESLMGFHVGGSCIELREYNGFGQLTSVYIDGTVASYRYKPNGLRYQKTVDGVAETHIWNGINMVAELNADNAVKAKYLRGVNLIARADGSQGNCYYFHNSHGDIVQKRDAGSGDLWYYEYDAFGNERDVQGQDKELDTNPFRYCGEYFDRETNTIYLRARYYKPGISRFLSEDPARDGLNWYTYCKNNPILMIDPDGLDCYIFYGPDQEKAVETYRSQLRELYPDTVVHTQKVTSADEFSKGWKSMSEAKTIEGVVINIHGNPDRMTPNGEDNGRITTTEIAKLKTYSMDFIYLGSCNTGHLDHRSSNVANTFATKQNARWGVIAPDGTHERPNSKFGWTQSRVTVTPAFDRFREKGSDRKSRGFISYYHDKDKNTMTVRSLSGKEEKESHSSNVPTLVGFIKKLYDK